MHPSWSKNSERRVHLDFKRAAAECERSFIATGSGFSRLFGAFYDLVYYILYGHETETSLDLKYRIKSP